MEITNKIASPKPFIDFSQYKAWMHCPWDWYEKYVNRREPVYPTKQRDDALAIGSMVHAGLEVWQRERWIEIPQTVLDEIGPTPEAVTQCKQMILGYTQAYPQEWFPISRCEEPLRFLLGDDFDGLAKIDEYFYVPEQTAVESGLAGYQLTLSPGWWIQEYKTKSERESPSNFMVRWMVDMQADFQMLALQDNVIKWGNYVTYQQVQGILITCIEKPNVYTPYRKCKGCQQRVDLGAWLPANGGASECPYCHQTQILSASKAGPKVEKQPTYFRTIATRTPKQLTIAKNEIRDVVGAMNAMRAYGMEAVVRNRTACVDPIWGKCRYYGPHLYGYDTVGHPDFQDTKDYVKEGLNVLN